MDARLGSLWRQLHHAIAQRDGHIYVAGVDWPPFTVFATTATPNNIVHNCGRRRKPSRSRTRQRPSRRLRRLIWLQWRLSIRRAIQHQQSKPRLWRMKANRSKRQRSFRPAHQQLCNQCSFWRMKWRMKSTPSSRCRSVRPAQQLCNQSSLWRMQGALNGRRNAPASGGTWHHATNSLLGSSEMCSLVVR